jgi:hypothetical protein
MNKTEESKMEDEQIRKLEALYLEYFNGFVRAEGFADYHNISDDKALFYIEAGRAAHEYLTKQSEDERNKENTAMTTITRISFNKELAAFHLVDENNNIFSRHNLIAGAYDWNHYEVYTAICKALKDSGQLLADIIEIEGEGSISKTDIEQWC